MLSAILILAGILSFFLISRESGHGVPEGLVVDMTATDTMKVNINGDYIQNNSYTLRELIDEDFGDGDGLSPQRNFVSLKSNMRITQGILHTVS